MAEEEEGAWSPMFLRLKVWYTNWMHIEKLIKAVETNEVNSLEE